MKKVLFALTFFVFCGFLAFADVDEQAEEIDFLLFMPNSSNLFVNQEQAVTQLDNLAKYLSERNLAPGQIYVLGYAAVADNDIEPLNLSRDRALFIISELQKRGVQDHLFSDPVGHGAVDLWGSNANEEDRSPNRRVRILVDGTYVTPVTMMAATPAPQPAPVVIVSEEIIKDEIVPPNKFPWGILLLWLLILAIFALIFFLLRRRKKAAVKPAPEEVPVSSPVMPSPPPAEEAVEKTDAQDVEPVIASVAVREIVVDLDEEIRFCAYILHLERNGQNGDMDGDWYMAVCQVRAKYEASGYRTYNKTGHWQAAKDFTKP